MKKHKLFFLCISFAGLFFISISCKEEIATNYTLTEDASNIPSNLDSVKLSYESLFNIKYGLTYPFVKCQSAFYFFENTYLKLYKYNPIDSTYISNFTYNTEEYNAYRNFYFTEGDSIVLASYSQKFHSLNIFSVNKEDLSLKTLKKNLILQDDLSTEFQSCAFMDNNRIIIILQNSNKILTIDTRTFSQNYSTDNHLSEYRHSASDGLAVILGKVGRDIYMYYYSYKILFKFNLDSYTYTEIKVPAYLKALMNDIWDKGAVVNHYFCFWPSISSITYCYDTEKGVWLKGGKNPFYQSMLVPLYYAFDKNNIYYKNGTAIKMVSIK